MFIRMFIKMRWEILIAIVLFTVAVLIFPYTGDSSPTKEKPPVKIGCIVWTEGPPLAAGRMYTRGFKSAISYINKKGGILGGRMVEGAIAPQGMTNETAKAAALKLCMKDKVKALFGPHFDGAQPAGLEVAQRFNIPYAAAQGGTWLYKQNYPGTLGLNGTAPARTNALLRWLEKKGVKTAVLLFTDISYNHEVEKNIKNKWEKPGSSVKVLDTIWYTFGQIELRKEITKAVGHNPDVIWSEAWSEKISGSIMKIIREFGYKGILALDSSVTREGVEMMPKEDTEGTYLNIEWAYDPNIRENKEFCDYWKEEWGRFPDAGEMVAWSNNVIMLKAMDKVGIEGDGSREYIMKYNKALHSLKWLSPRGMLNLSEEGVATWDKLALAQITSGQFKVIDYMTVYPNEYLLSD